MTLYEKVIAAGIPAKDIDSHESDLYLAVTEQTSKLLTEHGALKHIKIFVSHMDGRRWFDIPFMYQPFWDKKQANVSGR